MLWWIAATLVAFFVKGLCGFANTLVFTTMLSFGQNNLAISPVELLLGYPTNAILAWKERPSIDWKLCLPLCGMGLAGCLPGAFLLKNLDARLIKIFFGAVIVVIALEMLLRSGARGKQSRAVMLVIGILSGMLCGLFGVGALLGAYLTRVTDDTHAFKGNLCMVFFVENTFRMILYIASGIITLAAFKQALLLAPVMLVSLWLGMKAGSIINEKIAKKIVLAALLVSGIALIINSL